ncbi:hypothetical protein [Spirosoma oryzae]|uniref:hypothetical protein n=1 Tax=Spirosoma oryzae TaxID=1469603 RepID=UPI000D05B85D|nr:hypothetical protein [Spirosoma oryzae]
MSDFAIGDWVQLVNDDDNWLNKAHSYQIGTIYRVVEVESEFIKVDGISYRHSRRPILLFDRCFRKLDPFQAKVLQIRQQQTQSNHDPV